MLRVEKVTNIQICPQVGRVLNRVGLLMNTNLMFQRAPHKEQIEVLSVGFFYDSWLPAYLLVFPEFAIIYEEQLTVMRPLVVPLYEYASLV